MLICKIPVFFNQHVQQNRRVQGLYLEYYDWSVKTG